MNENKTEKEKRVNPFFVPYETPHETVPFNHIRTADYEEAFMEGIRRDNEEIDKIINNPETPTFENTPQKVNTITTCLTGFRLCSHVCSVQRPTTSLMHWHRK